MNTIVLLLPILVFVTILLLVYALTPPAQESVQARLRGYGHDLPARGSDLSQPFAQRILAPIFGAIARLAVSLTPGEIIRMSHLRLDQAGRPLGLDMHTFLVLRLVAMLALPIIYIGPALLKGQAVTIFQVLLAAGLAFIGHRLPDIWLSFRIDARKAAIQKALPDALDLIVVCVEAGQALEAALARVAETTKGPLADEINRTLGEMSLGKMRREALKDLGQRTEVPDLQSFLAAIIQADQMGVSIAEVLRIQADAMRVRRRQRAEEQAAKVPVKMLFPLVMMILPALLIMVLGPAGIRIMEFFKAFSSAMG